MLFLRNLARKTYNTIMWFIAVLTNIPHISSVSNTPSYFPEKIRKNRVRRFCDNLVWLIQKGELNRFYTQYGLDLVGSTSSNYIGFRSFMTLRNYFNQVKRIDNSIGILRDKYLFYKYMSANHISVPDVFALQKNDSFFDCDLNEVSIDFFKNEKNFFVKDVSGECASFVKHVVDYDNLRSLQSQMNKGMFLYQRKIIQHAEMDRLNPGAVNTIRIVTINENGRPYLFAAILRVGTIKSGCADNTSAGGLALGVHEDGSLFEKGLLKPQYGTSLAKHPDTGVMFGNFKIPYYTEAIRLVCRAHRFFYNVRSIGWDVAISVDGPVIIEGNDNWEITSIQSIYGGKKDVLRKMMR